MGTLYDFAREVNYRRKAYQREVMGTKLSFTRRIERVFPVRGRRICAMTFDDGPCAKDFVGYGKGVTECILDTLKQYGARGTFDIIGTTQDCYPDAAGGVGTPLFGGVRYDHYPCFMQDHLGGALNNENLIRRMIEEGHELANHTWSHRISGKKHLVYSKRVPFDSASDAISDVDRLHAYIKDKFGYTMRLARPAHYVNKLNGNGDMYDVYWTLGYQYCAASYDAGGWRPGRSYKEEVDSMVESMKKKLFADPDALNGHIISQKDGCNQSLRTPVIDALPKQLELLTLLGYDVIPVSELLELSPFVDLKPEGEVYDSVQQLIRLGHIVGYRDNTFHGERAITPQEMLWMLSTHREIRLDGDLGTYSMYKKKLRFTDGNHLLDFAQSEGVFAEERFFKDKPEISRTDAVKLISEVVKKHECEEVAP